MVQGLYHICLVEKEHLRKTQFIYKYIYLEAFFYLGFFFWIVHFWTPNLVEYWTQMPGFLLQVHTRQNFGLFSRSLEYVGFSLKPREAFPTRHPYQ